MMTNAVLSRDLQNARGGLAQLGERLHGMQEVSGSIPLSSILKALSANTAGEAFCLV